MTNTDNSAAEKKIYTRISIVTMLVILSTIPVFGAVYFLSAVASIFDLSWLASGSHSIWSNSGPILIPVLIVFLLLARSLTLSWAAYGSGLYPKASKSLIFPQIYLIFALFLTVIEIPIWLRIVNRV